MTRTTIKIGSLNIIVSEDITETSISCTSFDILVITSPFLASVKYERGNLRILLYNFFLRSLTVLDLINAIQLLARKIKAFLKRLATSTTRTARSNAPEGPYLPIKSESINF